MIEAAPMRMKVVRGLVWLLTGQWIGKLVSVASRIALSRILRPYDFGVLALAESYIGVFGVMSNWGIDQVLIRHKGEDQRVFAAGNTLRLGSALVCFVLLFALAPVWAGTDPAVVRVSRVLGLNLLILGFAFLPTVRLRREMRFGRLTSFQVVNAVVCAGVSLSLAVAGFGFWSLVWGGMAGVVCYTVGLAVMEPGAFTFSFRLSDFREVLGFSLYMFLSSLLIYLINNADDWVVGAVCGLGELGFYWAAFFWGNRVVIELVWAMVDVLYPALAALRDSPDFETKALAALRYVSAIVFPIYAAFLGVIPAFVNVFLGPQWGPVIPMLYLWALYGVIRSVENWVGLVFTAKGRMRFMAISAGIFILVGAAPMWFMTQRWRGVGMTMAFLGTSVFIHAFHLGYLHFRLGIRLKDVLGHYLPLLGIAGGAGAVAWGAGRLIGWAGVTALVGQTFITMAVYAGLVRWGMRDIWDGFGRILREAAGRPSSEGAKTG
ncbi:MAG: oligosaccharide flippase family protein [Planctomycetota bacterium]